MDIEVLIIRLVVGGVMFGHGAQKLFGWFGGHGIKGTKGFFGALGYPAAGAMALLAGLAEAGGGLLLATGFATPLAAAAIAGVLFNAIIAVHWQKGMWNSEGGLEFPLVLSASAIGVAFAGAGRFSVDALIGWGLEGTAWGMGAFGVGLAAAALTLAMRAVVRSAPAEAAHGRRAAA